MAALPINLPINKHLSRLKKRTKNVETFLDCLLINGILDNTKKTELLTHGSDSKIISKTYDYLLDTAEDILPLIYQSLDESDNSDLRQLLEASRGQVKHEGNAHRTTAFRLGGSDEVDSAPFTSSVKRGRGRLDLNPPEPWQAYKMGSRPKGYVLLINMEEFPKEPWRNRVGSEIDLKNLKCLFEDLGYIVEPYNNLIEEDLRKIVAEFSTHIKHKAVDSCIVFIMSHGKVEDKVEKFGHVECSDGEFVNVADIINMFVYPHTQVFGTEKPILFFFQSCRGEGRDYGQPKQSSKKGGKVTTTTCYTDGVIMNEGSPNLSDFYAGAHGRRYDNIIIINSCAPGHVTLRDPEYGSWFVDTLVKVFAKHAWQYDLDTMLSMIDSEIRNLACDSNGMQTTTMEKWGFTKKFYFNPGLYDDDSPVINTTCENLANCSLGEVDEKSKESNVDSVSKIQEMIILPIETPTDPPHRLPSSNGDLAQSTLL